MAFHYNVTDEGTIHAPREVVWSAYMSELGGAKDWWLPHWEAEPIAGDFAVGQRGYKFKATVHPPGWFLQLLFTPRFTVLMTDVEAPKRFHVEFPEGHFKGTGLFEFTSLNENETKVSFNWNVSTRGARPALAALFVNIGAIHSGIVEGGYRGLNESLRLQ